MSSKKITVAGKSQTNFGGMELKADELLERVVQGESLFAIAGFSGEHMQALYALAHTRYSTAKYDDAEQLFALLCILEHQEKRNWMGLGASRQMNKNYENAAYAYAQAAAVDISCPTSLIHLAECLLQLHRTQEIEKILEQAEKRCGKHPNHEELLSKIEFLRVLLHGKLAKERHGTNSVEQSGMPNHNKREQALPVTTSRKSFFY